jgi:hypothetical protein
MNEIERAVEHYRYGITHDIFSEPVTTYAKLAVDALREQAERSKGCDKCQPSCHNCKHDVYDDFCQYYGKQGCGKLLYEPKHKYCPMCGKRLEVEP